MNATTVKSVLQCDSQHYFEVDYKANTVQFNYDKLAGAGER
jgi:hypothetical protein